VRELFHPEREQLNLSAILGALGDPNRLQIVKNLSAREETTCGCCDVSLQKSAASHHFKVLREAGLIRVRIEGTQRFLSVRREDLEARFPGLIDSVLRNA